MATSPDSVGPDDDLRPEYDFGSLQGLGRGKYAGAAGRRVVRLDDDVASAFKNEAAVNAALREYLRNRPAGQEPA
ncbi:MAG: hypothetical protein ACRC1K_25810 [Planctomycetia bacterium]